jgi:hypothetical protein
MGIAGGGVMASMTKGERSELGALIRKRERVMKSAAAQRAAEMVSELDRQLASIYSFDDDQIWKKAVTAAGDAVKEANLAIAERCRELGIPPEFAPGLSFGWYGRGQNAVAVRRAELRRLAKSRIEAMEKDAIVKIERLSLDAQTEVIAHGLESDAAKAFLGNMAPVDTLMPAIDVLEVKALVDQRHAKDDEEE